MAPILLIEPLHLGLALALIMIGAVTAWVSGNLAKRLAGLLIANIGAAIALAVLQAPSGMILAGVAIAFAEIVIGVALLVRLQESYGGIEAPDFDSADEQSEPTEIVG